MFFATEERYMAAALAEAERAAGEGEIPVGCVIVKNGVVIASAHNEKEQRALSTAHAEIVAIERASKVVGTWYLDGCTMYVTLEPCAMCAGALINSRIDRVVYGTEDKRFGACGTLYNLPADKRFNHTVAVEGGLMREDCLAILQEFFRALRKKPKKGKDGAEAKTCNCIEKSPESEKREDNT